MPPDGNPSGGILYSPLHNRHRPMAAAGGVCILPTAQAEDNKMMVQERSRINTQWGRHPLCGILHGHALTAMMQPILSVGQKRIVGYEGLARGIHPMDGGLVPPLTLFSWADHLDGKMGHPPRPANGSQAMDFLPVPGRSCVGADGLRNAHDTERHCVALDRLCRETCLDGFRPLYAADPETHLFLNLDASVIDGAAGSDHLLRQVDAAGIPHGNVVIEISEGGVRELSSLIRFVRRYRELGFLIALDDLGAGFCNLDRLSLIKPDLIKLDRSLIQGMETSFHKQEVFRCLVGLANKVGALIVAEGVETREELYAAIALGAHFIQGYFFARPGPPGCMARPPLSERMEEAASGYVRFATERLNRERTIRSRRDNLLHAWIRNLEQVVAGEREALLASFLRLLPDDDCECAYLLHQNGIQSTDTIFREAAGMVRRTRGHVFTPTHAGADNSMKRYYHELMNAGTGRYVSEPYVSHATGTVCITHSRLATGVDGETFVLCVDFLLTAPNAETPATTS